jgi:hypothetical protein
VPEKIAFILVLQFGWCPYLFLGFYGYVISRQIYEKNVGQF